MSKNTKSLVQLLMEAGYTNVDVMTKGEIVKGKDYLEQYSEKEKAKNEK